MEEGTDVVRTTRLEVIDRSGRTRVVIGTLAEDGDMVGLSIRDVYGSERLFVVTDEDACEAGITGSGNNLAGARADVEDAVSAAVYAVAPDGTVVHWP